MTKVNQIDIVPVVCAIIIRESKVLATQRSHLMPLPGKWEFPGGKVKPGETEESALKREIKEELKVGITILSKVGAEQIGPIRLTAYFARVITGEIRLTEHAALKWCNQHELKGLDWAVADVPFVNQLLDGFSGVWAV